MTSENDISRWVTEALHSENIKNPVVTVLGSSDKGENYGGEITFAVAKGITIQGEDCEFHVVVKTGRRNDTLREDMNFKLVYYREVYMYNAIFPALREFQLKSKSKNLFNSIPKCYKTIVEENVEVLVLENLKKNGFVLHNRQVSMNESHIKLVLWNYAIFHAVSFAMRDQDPEQFNKLSVNLKPLMGEIMAKTYFEKLFQEMYDKNAEYVQETDPELYVIMTDIFGPRMVETFIQICQERVNDGVIIHGDCWNNNFMFRYEGNNEDHPKDVAIIDWQVSCIHSPILDLSYFLYLATAGNELKKFEEYLKFYYQSLSQFIEEMGSDPEKLYPYSKLLKQWNKYSKYGIMFFISGLQMMIADKDDAPSSMENYEELKNSIDKLSAKNQERFRARFLPTIRHFCTWNRNKNT